MAGCSCEASGLRFAVPEPLREYAPETAPAAELCPACLTLAAAAPDAVDDGGAPTFDRLHSSFPDGEAGVAMALALGLIADSVALNRAAIGSLFEAVADAGADPWIALERVASTPTAGREVDLDRAAAQLDQLLR